MITLIGQTFGALTVIADLPPRRNKSGVSIRRVLCECKCGRKHEVDKRHLRVLKSCGCLNPAKRTHGLSGGKNRTYRIWANMKDRCGRPGSTSFKYYGARNIKVCERWMKFALFYQDMGECPPGLTIDRIDSGGNYEPGNCEWSTVKEQARNKRNNLVVSLRGKTGSLAELAEYFGVNYSRTHLRITRYHWPIEQAFFAPSQNVSRTTNVVDVKQP